MGADSAVRSVKMSGPRWLQATRLLLGVVLLAACITFVWLRRGGIPNTCSEDNGALSIIVWFVAVPYLFALAPLWRQTSRQVKKGLAWAVASGGFWGLAIAAVILIGLDSRAEAALAIAGVILQAALVTCAIKSYHSLPREPQDRKILIERVALLAVYLVVAGGCVIALPDFYATDRQNDAASAVHALHIINAAEARYVQTSGKGYSPSLDVLLTWSQGPTPGVDHHALQEAIASQAASHYELLYTPGTANASGAITTYTLRARPREAACTRWRNFLTDPSGTIWESIDNTPATKDSTVHE